MATKHRLDYQALGNSQRPPPDGPVCSITRTEDMKHGQLNAEEEEMGLLHIEVWVVHNLHHLNRDKQLQSSIITPIRMMWYDNGFAHVVSRTWMLYNNRGSKPTSSGLCGPDYTIVYLWTNITTQKMTTAVFWIVKLATQKEKEFT